MGTHMSRRDDDRPMKSPETKTGEAPDAEGNGT
jgi:hypothetical protein